MFLDGELSPSMTAEVHAHLLQCPSCQKETEVLRACSSVIAKDRLDAGLTDDFATRVLASMPPASGASTSQLITRRSRRERLWRVGLGGGLPAAAAALFFAVLIWPSEESIRPTRVAGMAVEAAGVKSVVSPTLETAADARRAAQSLNQLVEMSVRKATDDARQGMAAATSPDKAAKEPSVLDILLLPFNDLVPGAKVQPAPEGGDPVVRF
jgi:anti-sigma factor RsiW